jgi:hypothetical protein
MESRNFGKFLGTLSESASTSVRFYIAAPSTPRRTLAGYEAMAMIRKGQVRNIGGSDIRARAEFITGLFQLAA